MAKREKVYFASDFHLGSPNHAESKEREKKICNWLDNIAENAKEIYLVGDIFDFWFEYKMVIPKGFERLKGKLAHFTDQGIEIHFFPGNHDLWTFGYLEKELGLIVHKKPLITKIEDKTFYICHGDGLGNGGLKYKFLSIQKPLVIYNIHGKNLSIEKIKFYIRELTSWIEINEKKIFKKFDLKNLKYFLFKLKLKKVINNIPFLTNMGV